MIKIVKQNKSRIMSFVCVMVIFISMCGFTANSSVASEETTEETNIEYYNNDYVAVLSDVYEAGFIDPVYTASNVNIHLAQTYADYYYLYNTSLCGFDDLAYTGGMYVSELVDKLPIYLPNIAGNPFTYSDARIVLHSYLSGGFTVEIFYCLGDKTCIVPRSYYGSSRHTAHVFSNNIFYRVSYAVSASDSDSDGVIDKLKCGTPVYNSVTTSTAVTIDEVKYSYYYATFSDANTIAYSDFPVFNMYTATNINNYINGASADSDIDEVKIGAYYCSGYENDYTYLINDLRPRFYNFSEDDTEEDTTDTEESYKNHMYLTYCDIVFSGSTYAYSTIVENFNYDAWISENIDNYYLKTDIVINTRVESSGSCNFEYENFVPLSDLKGKINILYLNQILETSYVMSDNERVFFFDYYNDFGENTVRSFISDLFTNFCTALSGDTPVSIVDPIGFEYLSMTVNVRLLYKTNNGYEYSSAFIKSWDILSGTEIDSSDGITINNNPWGGSESSDGTVSGALGNVTESFNAIVESGAVSLGDVLATIGDITTSSMIESGAINNTVSGGSVTIEEGAISAQGGSATISEGAISAQGGNSTISEDAISINIDNNNNNDINTEVGDGTSNTKSLLQQLFSMINLFSDNSFLSLINLVFGFLPSAVITLLGTVTATIAIVGLIKFIKR